MHIPDGLLDIGTSASTAVVSAVAVGHALRKVRTDLPDRAAPLMGMTAACLFAAQSLNVPLLIVPASGHVLGGVLAAVLLGPWGGLVTMAAVLVVQCFLFQDGGITALGANVLIIGVIGSGIGYALYATARRWIAGPGGIVAAAALASWFSVQLSAVVASGLIALGPHFELRQLLGVMILAHSIIGLGEAVVTALAVSFILRQRPDLLYGSDRPAGWASGLGQLVLAVSAVAIVAAVIAAPFSSGLPDGLERSLAEAGFAAPTTVPLASPFAGYRLPGADELAVAGSIVATIGVVAVFLVAFGLGRAATSGVSATAHTTDAS